MNLRIFLQKTDEITKDMSKEKLEAFVHEIGRILPERERSDYLDYLKIFAGLSPGKKGGADVNSVGVRETLQEKCDTISDDLIRIDDGKIKLAVSYNYEYDDWYDIGDEFIFSDPEGIAGMVEEAASFVHCCVDCKAYDCGYQIAETLIAMKIYGEGEEWEDFYEALSVRDLQDHNLSEIDYRQLVVDALYLTYCVKDMADRPDELYQMIMSAGDYNVTLEMVMQDGQELEQIDEFLPLWINYLGTNTERTAQKLLKEALGLSGDSERLLNTAREYVDFHPGVYEQYLDSICENGSIETVFEIGDEALDKINPKYIVRSRISIKLGERAAKEDLYDKAWAYRIEAFRSDTSIINYMRLLAVNPDKTISSEEIKEIYRSMYDVAKKNRYKVGSGGELMENLPTANTIYMLLFFGGEFQYVIDHGMNVSEALGWSFTFMKCGLAAFLLLLLEKDELSQGGKEMCSKIISDVDFDEAIYQRDWGSYAKSCDENCFWNCFKLWKSKITLSEEQKQKYLKRIETLIKKRVKGIMEANRRRYYGECASYIAALGEVMESRGEQSGRQRIFKTYKKLYSRRSAFHRELRNYGMND